MEKPWTNYPERTEDLIKVLNQMSNQELLDALLDAGFEPNDSLGRPIWVRKFAEAIQADREEFEKDFGSKKKKAA